MLLTIPGDPITKGRPRVVGSNTYTPARTRAAEKKIRALWIAEHGRVISYPKPTPLSLRATFRCATRRRADIDNLLKTVLDALNGAAYTDDSQIEHLDVVVIRGVGYDSANTQLSLAQWANDR